MRNLPPLPTLHELLRLFNLKACGQLSQNFLFQPWPIKALVNCAGGLENSNVLEVGPGPGGITRYILQKNPHHLAVVELDSRFLLGLQQLQDTAKSFNIKMDVYNQDILKFNYENVFPLIQKEVHPDQAWHPENVDNTDIEKRKTHIIGNLPFSVSTPLLTQWLHDISEKRGLWTYAKVPLTVTFQEGIANRMVADTDDPERSRFSILCQSLCELKIKRIIPGTAFLPKAKVNTAVVHMVPRSKPLIDVPYPYLYKLVKAIFQFKTKYVLSGIESLFPSEHCKLIFRMFSATGIDSCRRPIELTIEEFKLLTEEYYKICQEIPTVFDYDFRHRQHSLDYKDRKKLQRIILDGKFINASTINEYLKEMREENTTSLIAE